MSDRSAIEWTDATWNPIRGVRGRWHCEKVSPGCEYCYAERLNQRFGGPAYKVGADELRLDEEVLLQPLRWKRPRRIFVCSMTDLFQEAVPSRWIGRIFGVMAACPQHTFQVLTKRAERMHDLLPDQFVGPVQGEAAQTAYEMLRDYRGLKGHANQYQLPGWPLPNVWLGVSAENQQYADERIPLLLATPAAVRFVSCEPLLGPLTLTHIGLLPEKHRVDGFPWLNGLTGNVAGPDDLLPHLDWVIAGGESGGPAGRRLVSGCDGDCSLDAILPCCGKRADLPSEDVCKRQCWLPIAYHAEGRPPGYPLAWVCSLRDQCVSAGVPFLFKQFGGPTHSSGGRLLDGRTWDQYPDSHGGIIDLEPLPNA